VRRRAPGGRTLVVLAGLLLMSARAFAADRQIRPLIGTTFAGSTTFVDPELAADNSHLVIGVSAVFLGEIFGAEVDVADAPGFFEAGDKQLVRSSHVTTLTGNVVIAAPHRLTEYSLRPYFVGGFGLMSVNKTTAFTVFDDSAVIPAWDAGVGAVAFLTNKVGIAGEIRRFHSVGSRTSNTGLSFGEAQLTFWRATVAAVIRY
jgi:hypothetical protein